ncbi:tyrosinase family protein [Chloroflexi bacterium TSY]|nr:tyrosinase family protein [Chloroflexi bacterium TSY]
MHNFAGGKNPEYVPDSNEQSKDNPRLGDMTDNRVTAFDPIFWSHHCNVDRLWAVWQEQNPGINPEDVEAPLPPWPLSVKDTLSIKKLGYEYMKDTYFYPTVNDMPMICFNSEKAQVRSAVLDRHRKVEVRLHCVQKARRNAAIRVFLNAPEANADTATVNNDHYVGQLRTFGGLCIGGPGHCDVPFPRTRRFDLRPLHHNEPRNFRIDATDAVRRMIAKGEDDISVHLVAVDIDGTPTNEALYFDGVSLNFMD